VVVISLGEAILAGFELVLDFFPGSKNKPSGSGPNLCCHTCGRKLEVASDPLSGDCEGDCWGCVGHAEFGLWDESTAKVEAEIASDLRNADGSAKS
jgi:hypothetical protein